MDEEKEEACFSNNKKIIVIRLKDTQYKTSSINRTKTTTDFTF